MEGKLSAKLKFSDLLLTTRMMLFERYWYLVFYVFHIVERLQEQGRVIVPVLVPDTIDTPRVGRGVPYYYSSSKKDPDEFVYPALYVDLSPSVN